MTTGRSRGPSTAKCVRPGAEALFYDGSCGMCHAWVKRVMRADRDGSLFYFAPLQGDHIKQVLSAEQIAALPDSVVVATGDGRVLTKSSAIAHTLCALGGWYRVTGAALALLPRPLRNVGYDCVAKARHKLYRKPQDACPLVPPAFQDRFKF